MHIPLFQIDAFSDNVFGGNPAAVCPLDTWLPDATMQAIALENNLSETAFFAPRSTSDMAGAGEGAYDLRWFTPETEIDLCGHATLASAWLILNRLRPGLDSVEFFTRSGRLAVGRRENDLLEMDFPARPPGQVDVHPRLVASLGSGESGDPIEVLATERDYFVVYEREEDVRRLAPDMSGLRAVDRLGIIVTAPGEGCDFVSRFFGPALGVPEDPVTGSAHCSLVPYWAARLGRKTLHARQVSSRGGELWCEDRGERTAMAGRAVGFMEGRITL